MRIFVLLSTNSLKKEINTYKKIKSLCRALWKARFSKCRIIFCLKRMKPTWLTKVTLWITVLTGTFLIFIIFRATISVFWLSAIIICLLINFNAFSCKCSVKTFYYASSSVILPSTIVHILDKFSPIRKTAFIDKSASSSSFWKATFINNFSKRHWTN